MVLKILKLMITNVVCLQNKIALILIKTINNKECSNKESVDKLLLHI